MSDEQITGLIQNGDYDAAFNAIVAAWSERLYWHLRRYAGSHEDADDLLQDVLVKVWKALPTFRCDSQLFTWIYRIATNEALNFLRKNRFKAMLKAENLESLLNSHFDDDVHFNGDELQREVQKAINMLPDKQKQVFIIRYFDELPYEQISEILDTSVGSLKASYHHAYNKVKAYLETKF